MPPDTIDTLVSFFKALADPSRLRILGLLAQKERSVDELAALLEVKAPTVSHHLKRLSKLALVTMRSEGNSHLYRLDEDALHRMTRDVLSAETIAQAADDIPEERFASKVRSNFIVAGKLTNIPAQRKKRDVILRWLAGHFQTGRDYTEPEVNAIIKPIHLDTATLRRELVGSPLMTRENGIYRRTEA